jgi:broad specificity phosphatase PhoE
MPSVLKSVEWGVPALNLLSQHTQLDPNLPAIMHIRHSERPQINSQEERKSIVTDVGKKAAYEFGANLPLIREYRIFYSTANRAIQTAQLIQKGLRSNSVRAQLKDKESLLLNGDENRYWYYINRDVSEIQAENIRARAFFIKLISDHYPPSEIESPRSFSQRTAFYMMEHLKKTQSDGFDIYVSHDISVASLLLYWCGILPGLEWIQFLDGFILQLTDEHMLVYSKYGKKEIYYPHWWNF